MTLPTSPSSKASRRSAAGQVCTSVRPDLAAFTTNTLTPASPKQRGTSLWLLDDALLLASDNVDVAMAGPPLTSFLLADDSEVPLTSGLNRGFKIVGNDDRFYVFGRNEIAVFDAATSLLLDVNGDGTNITFQSGVQLSSHFGAITPF